MRAGNLNPVKLGLFVVLSVSDLAMTYGLLSSSDGAFYESNPIASAWLARFGWAGLISFKAGIVVVVAALNVVIALHRPDVASSVLTFACAVVAVVVAYSAACMAAEMSVSKYGLVFAAPVQEQHPSLPPAAVMHGNSPTRFRRPALRHRGPVGE